MDNRLHVKWFEDVNYRTGRVVEWVTIQACSNSFGNSINYYPPKIVAIIQCDDLICVKHINIDKLEQFGSDDNTTDD